MPTKIIVKPRYSSVRVNIEEQAQAVLNEFKDTLQSDRKLLCFFDDKDCQSFKQEFGNANRGLFRPLKDDSRLEDYWPNYLREVLHVPMGGLSYEFHEVIYLHGSTCSNPIGLTMTLAHELQHSVQHSKSPKLFWANHLPTQLDRSVIKTLELRCCDIPFEFEARIVAKRITQRLFQTSEVDSFIDEELAKSDGADSDWKCIKEIDTSIADYDLLGETRKLFQKLTAYEAHFVELLKGDLDLTDVELRAILDGNVA